MTKKALFFGVSAVLLGAVIVGVFEAPTASAAPQSTLIGWCVDNGVQPYIYLEWGSSPVANSNGLQKGDSHPGDPERFWDWLPTNGDQRSYSDYAITRGVTYAYRVKYRPELPSNEVRITCGMATVSPTPYPTPTVTPYPTPVPNSVLSLTMSGRNVTRGQVNETSSLTARGNETLDIVLRVRNNSNTPATNVVVLDILPVGVNYIARSTSLNGLSTAEGVTSSGINIGTLWSGQEATIRFFAVVDPNSVPTWGQVDVFSTAQARADNASLVMAQLPIRLGQTVAITPISQVPTGPADTMLASLLLSVIATGAYALYTTTPLFSRRMALAEVRRAATRTRALNFSR